MKNKIKHITAAIALTLGLSNMANAQVTSQKIGTNPTTIAPSAVLDIESTNKGVLFPRVNLTSTTDAVTIASPAEGLTIYNTATAGTSPNNVTPGYYYWNGSRWTRLATAAEAFARTVFVNATSPNTATIFAETNPATTNVDALKTDPASLYIGNDGSTWTYDPTGAGTYRTYIQPSSTPFNLANSTTDAGSNKTGSIWRAGGIGIGTNNSPRLLDVVNNASTFTSGIIEAEGPVSSIFTRAMAIRMRRGTSALPTAILLNDISAFGFAGYDGSTFSSAAAGVAGVATENWTTTNKGMALSLSTSANTTAAVTERMRIDHNGNVGIGATSPIGRLIVNDNSYITNIPASTAHLMDNTTYRPLSRLQVTAGTNNNALSTYATTATFGMQAHNYSTGNSLTLALQPIGGRVGIGSDQPIGQLANHGTNYIGTIGTGVVSNNFSWASSFGGTMATLYNSGTQGNTTTLLVGSAGTTTNTLIEASTGVNSSTPPTRNIFIIKGTGNIGIHKAAPTQQLHFGNSGNVTANKTYNGALDEGLSINHYINSNSSSSTENGNSWARVADIVVASPVTGAAGTGVLRFLTSTNAELGGPVGERMRIHGNGNVGIGTTAPKSRLEVDGAVTNKEAFDAGSSTTIDFSKSNLAYTNANPGNTFTLSNIKDGGTYTLAVQGTTAGTAFFTASGFTFKTSNNGLTASGKETLYTFMVMGTKVYFYMTIGL